MVNKPGVPANPYGGTNGATTTTPAGNLASYDVNSANVAFRIAPTPNGDPAGSGNQMGPNVPIGPINVGGCMDFHGVAQQLGYSFSFVLLGNQSGAAIDTQEEAEFPPKPNTLPDGS